VHSTVLGQQHKRPYLPLS